MLDKMCIFDSAFESGLKEHSGVALEALPVYLGGTTSDSQCPSPEMISLGVGKSL
jgi:hypothetical protein